MAESTKNILLVSIVLLLFTLNLFYQHQKTGFLWGSESDKYIDSAHLLLQGDYTYVKFFLPYSGHIGFLALCFSIWDSNYFAWAITIFLHLIALWLLFKCFKKAGIKEIFCFALTSIYAINPMLHICAITLFTETLFISIATITLCWLFIGVHGRWLSICFLFLLLLLTFIRPFGMAFTLPMLYYFWRKNNKKQLPYAYFIISSLIMLLFMIAKMPLIEVTLPVAQANIVYGIGGQNASGFDGNSLLAAHLFLFEKYGLLGVLKIMCKKIFLFVIPVRSYFSNAHNVINLICCVGFYPLFFLKSRTHNDFVKMLLVIIGINILLISITWVEWHERFTITLIPLFLLAAAFKLSNSKVGAFVKANENNH
jgi:hypothetical protein